jgi:hypothetical protein
MEKAAQRQRDCMDKGGKVQESLKNERNTGWFARRTEKEGLGAEGHSVVRLSFV